MGKEECCMEKIKSFFKDVFSIESDRASNAEIKNTILSGARLKGANMCILVLAIMIASIGLNMNSTAIVIGAMLISPLMGGILGIGYGMATNDLRFAKKSFIALGIEVCICIITSALYFFLSPISTTSNELLARTHPTIWDVMIAFAGGLAGIIGITRKEKSNVIPGVAIATAIMPPLCTAGYALATWQPKYFLGALYLFFINGFFICLASVIVLRLMRIPKKKGADVKEEKKIQRSLGFVAVLTIIPSIFLAYQIVSESVINSNVQHYLADEFHYEGTQIVSSKVDVEKKRIEIALIGKTLSENQILDLTNDLKAYHLSDMNLRITQTEIPEGVSEEDVEQLIKQSETSFSTKYGKDIEDIKAQLLKINTTLFDKNTTTYDVEAIKKDLKSWNGKISDVTITNTQTQIAQTTQVTQSLIVKLSLTGELSAEEDSYVLQYLKEKLGKEEITIEKVLV